MELYLKLGISLILKVFSCLIFFNRGFIYDTEELY